MKVIGITGGVGSGKTKVLAYLKSRYNCEVILADEVAHKIKEPGGRCYAALVELLGRELLAADGTIDKGKMAKKIFGDPGLLKQVNGLMHPMVKEYILEEIARAESEGRIDVLFLEAALLIEDGYGEIVDELWYIYADEKVRRQRLQAFRGYSGEKIEGILKRQLSEEEFRKHCRVVIDNSGNPEDTYRQVRESVEALLRPCK